MAARTRLTVLVIAGLLALNAAPRLVAQDTLSNQVLRLLTRNSPWTGTQTFSDLRVANAAIPSITTYRIYADTAGNLYFNGGLIAGSGGGVTPHNILSTTHADTTADTVVRGDVITGQGASPTWKRLARGTTKYVLTNDGTDVTWGTDASALTSIPAANITGTLGAISGVNLTALNATQLTSGTVPLARLVGITNTEIAAGAAIVRSKLSLAAGITLTTDVAGVLPFANGGTNLSTAADDTVMVSSGSAWVAKAVPNCTTTTSALGYTTATNTFSCIAVAVGTGTVTSAGLAMPAIFSVASSPITTSGTITVSLATEAANLVWAGPTSGSAAAPTFRALVSADIPLTLASGTITSSTPWNWTQTWNAAGVTFRGVEYVFTETASAAASTYARWLGGAAGTTVEFAINKGGTVLANGNYTGTAGTSTLGTTALPFLSAILGTAATNNLTIQPAAFSQGTVATADDPKLTTVKLALIKRGTLAFATTAVTNGTCSTPVTATITGLLTTAAVFGSPNTALQTNWKTGVRPVFYATADTVNLTICNPTAGSITPENQTFNYVVVVP
jgi:hypothetical protein